MRSFGHEIWMKFNAWPTKRAEYSILPLFNFKRADLQVMEFDCSLLNLNAPCHLFMHQLLIVNGCIYIPHDIRLESSSSYSIGKVSNIQKINATTLVQAKRDNCQFLQLFSSSMDICIVQSAGWVDTLKACCFIVVLDIKDPRNEQVRLIKKINIK